MNNELETGVVDVETVLDFIEKEKELYLTIKASDVETVKQRISQAKFKRGNKERLSMKASEPYPYLAYSEVVDLHCKLGAGVDILVLGYRLVDNEL